VLAVGGAGGSGIVILKYEVTPVTTVDVVQTFEATSSWTCPTGVTEVEYLVVAGGGGGGWLAAQNGGGGGAGGFRTATGFQFPQGLLIQLPLVLVVLLQQKQAVVILCLVPLHLRVVVVDLIPRGKMVDLVVVVIQIILLEALATPQQFLHLKAVTAALEIIADSGCYTAGGGGGAGEAGNTDGQGEGGDGTASSISGTSTTYAGGGGGMTNLVVGGTGGDGGGGAGGHSGAMQVQQWN
jgi:hypothetical protein